MNNFRMLSLSALLAASAGAQAANFSYDYVEGSFGELQGNADAIYLGGSMAMDKTWGLLGNVGFGNASGNVDGTTIQGGVFFHTPLNNEADFYGNARIVYAKWDTPFGNADDLGVQAVGGIRYAVQDNFHLEGEIGLYEVDPGFTDTGLGVKVDARYYMNKQLSAAAGVASDLDYDGIFVGLRYNLK